MKRGRSGVRYRHLTSVLPIVPLWLCRARGDRGHSVKNTPSQREEDAADDEQDGEHRGAVDDVADAPSCRLSCECVPRWVYCR